MIYYVILLFIASIGITIIFYEYKIKNYKKLIEQLETDHNQKMIEIANNTKNQLIEKDHECNKKLHSVEKRYNNLLINNIFDLYQAALVIRKYNIHKYEIDIQNDIVYVYCTMQTYTKMSIGKEILPNIKYHINGTNVIL